MSDDLDNDHGMKCPHCGSSNRIDVAATVWVRLCHDGTDIHEAANTGQEWTDNSSAYCGACGHGGTVASFTKIVTDNETRADLANGALRQYVEASGEAFEQNSSEISDLIADLLHLAARWDQGDDPIDSTLRLARMHFDAEQDEEGVDL